ncbi:MAG: LexA family protein [Pseudomonadota bacterium]|jgi:DNA polymerase V|nr:translesion error-prone DNA polymerase V autoproteolytic subunit [Alphaproteobacteria bacterium]
MTRGGIRKGAGRKPNSGKFGEQTGLVRVPKSLIPHVKEALMNVEKVRLGSALSSIKAAFDWQSFDLPSVALPMFSNKVSAGFPSPADDHMDMKLDLNQHLVQHPAATFFVRVSGDSMIGAGIYDGDILVVDRSLICRDGGIVIAVVDGELTVKRFFTRGKEVLLKAENPKYPDIIVSHEMDFRIWGIVTTVIHKV